MQAVFQRCLRPANGATVTVARCAVDFVRSVEKRCLLQYTLHLVDDETGQTSKQWVTGAIYGGDLTRRVWQHLLAADSAAMRPVGSPSLLPLAYVPGLDLLVQVFPYDHLLPGLGPVLQGVPELTAALLEESEAVDWRVEEWHAEVVRYRPALRALIRLELLVREAASGRSLTRRAFAKVFPDGESGARATRILELLWQRTSREDVGFTVARPMADIVQLQTLLMSELPGNSLLDVMRLADEAETTEALRRVARAVAGLHQLALSPDLLPPAKWDERERLAEIAATLRGKDPAQSEAIDDVVAVIDAGLGDAPLAPTHFDLKPGNILVDGKRVALLDFDKLAWGDPLVDAANFMAYLGRELGGAGQGAATDAAGADLRRGVPRPRAELMADLAAGPLRLRRPGRGREHGTGTARTSRPRQPHRRRGEGGGAPNKRCSENSGSEVP